MYQPSQQTARRYSEISGDNSVKSKGKRFGFESENGSIVRIKNLSLAASANVSKHSAQDAIRHLAQPTFVDLTKKAG